MSELREALTKLAEEWERIRVERLRWRSTENYAAADTLAACLKDVAALLAADERRQPATLEPDRG